MITKQHASSGALPSMAILHPTPHTHLHAHGRMHVHPQPRDSLGSDTAPDLQSQWLSAECILNLSLRQFDIRTGHYHTGPREASAQIRQPPSALPVTLRLGGPRYVTCAETGRLDIDASKSQCSKSTFSICECVESLVS